MGYSKPKDTTKAFLQNATLPTHGQSYTVISHKDVIDNTTNMLTQSGFQIDREIYRANLDANVAQGIYHIKPINPTDNTILNEKEVGMMFAWTNSYDKSKRFQCAIGGYVFVCHNGMIAGDMMNFARKHTGSANFDIKMQIMNQIKNGEQYYKRILSDKDSLRQTILTKKEQAELLGRLYCDENLLNVSQLSCIKSEMNKPSFDYNCDAENAWAFYNHVTHAIKEAHPRNWLSDTQKFHEFIVTNTLSKMGINRSDSKLTEIDEIIKDFEYVDQECIELDY